MENIEYFQYWQVHNTVTHFREVFYTVEEANEAVAKDVNKYKVGPYTGMREKGKN
jgi:hypothetical protein